MIQRLVCLIRGHRRPIDPMDGKWHAQTIIVCGSEHQMWIDGLPVGACPRCRKVVA